MKKITLTRASDKEFINNYVSDGVYRKIVRELTKSGDLKGRGRKIELTAEKLHNFLYYLSIGASYKLASESAQIPESTRQKYMARSEEFQRVASLAKENVTILALEGICRAIAGRKPGYYAVYDPTTKETAYILLGYIQPNVRAAMWYLDQTKYFERIENKSSGENQLGAPRNEEEAKLLEDLLNRHYDYVQEKEQKAQL